MAISKIQWCAAALLALVPLLARPAADAPPGPLRSASQVLSLSAEQASRRLRVEVTGVVTAAEPNWQGQFFVQDETGGIFVENLGKVPPIPGDRVVVRGVSHPGAFAPIISAPVWEKLGSSELPEPKHVLIDNLESGVEDGLRVEVTGIVHSTRLDDGRLVLDLAVAGYRLQAYIRVPAELKPSSLIAARVLVRGTAATHYNGVVRHLTSVAVYVPRPEDFIVLEHEATNPFEAPVIPVTSVAQYRRGSSLSQRVHLRGAVTWQRAGEELFIQDGSGGIRIVSSQTDSFRTGETVEAVGFIEYRERLPLLRDAILRPSRGAAVPVAPQTVLFKEIQLGKHHGELIRISGKVLDRTVRPAVVVEGKQTSLVTTWLLQRPEGTFTVERDGEAADTDSDQVPIGSTVEAVGVCVSTVDIANDEKSLPVKLTSLRILLEPTERLEVVSRPSWFTPARLLAGIGLLTLGLVVVGTWLLTIAKKNAALREVIRGREKAQRDLQEAHDTLEQKVQERSAQLQVEMTARKTSEVEFKAVLAERTRLARDLHDTLEQTLTGIALQLDASSNLANRDPGNANNHLQMARNWLRQSQVELRRSIWDLRSRELEQFDLAGALRHTAEQLVNTSEATVSFDSTGTQQRLPEVVEENALRIGQEALTNIAKHARATRISIRFSFTPNAFTLSIKDDGVGFEHDGEPQPEKGHFGLIGMYERAKRLNGELTIESKPGMGTRLVAVIPLEGVRTGRLEAEAVTQ